MWNTQKAAARANTHSNRRELTAVLKCKGSERLEARVVEIEQANDDGCKMFAAFRALGIRSTSGVSINDSCSQLHDHRDAVCR